MRTILTARTDGRPIAGWESAHFEGIYLSRRPDDHRPRGLLARCSRKGRPSSRASCQPQESPMRSRTSGTRTSVCPVNVPGVLSYQDYNRHLTALAGRGHLRRLTLIEACCGPIRSKVFDVAPGHIPFSLKQVSDDAVAPPDLRCRVRGTLWSSPTRAYLPSSGLQDYIRPQARRVRRCKVSPCHRQPQGTFVYPILLNDHSVRYSRQGGRI